MARSHGLSGADVLSDDRLEDGSLAAVEFLGLALSSVGGVRCGHGVLWQSSLPSARPGGTSTQAGLVPLSPQDGVQR